mmetsp:Transcript_18081/g.23792  ORF Transcript_18081/g.23792 Transcript_18081/m.23792 type:complete len:87 (+) Transcript_18081:321-581(+)
MRRTSKVIALFRMPKNGWKCELTDAKGKKSLQAEAKTAGMKYFLLNCGQHSLLLGWNITKFVGSSELFLLENVPSLPFYLCNVAML